MKLIIEDDEGRKTVVPLVREEITIGRQDGNTIRLTERNVSRRHARLVKENGNVVIEDLGSYNGVRVNATVCALVNEQNLMAQALFMKSGYKLRGYYETVFLERRAREKGWGRWRERWKPEAQAVLRP